MVWKWISYGVCAVHAECGVCLSSFCLCIAAWVECAYVLHTLNVILCHCVVCLPSFWWCLTVYVRSHPPGSETPGACFTRKTQISVNFIQIQHHLPNISCKIPCVFTSENTQDTTWITSENKTPCHGLHLRTRHHMDYVWKQDTTWITYRTKFVKRKAADEQLQKWEKKWVIF